MEIKDIKDSKFIKNLDIKQMENLANDMRKFLIQNISKTGGHLSSNLGIVDLTIAMAKVFDFDKDIILFDVGHNTYPYKILTGRAGKFNKLRKFDGLCGFQSLKESKYDHYETGHAGTSISSGLGFAIARDLNKEKQEVISVIGDGSFGNGLAYEALNNLGGMNLKQIIILNDNQMSISENVGAIHNFLDKIRSDKGYENAKSKAKNVLNKSIIGKPLFKILNFTKKGLKKIYLRKGSMWEDLNIEYYGPINGHDYKELLKYLEIAKKETHPVILHVITQKGKGYEYAENDKIGLYHGTGPFDIQTGKIIENNLPSYSEVISSFVYNYARKDQNILCITPAMALGSKLLTIKEKLPNQYIDVGMAEEHALIIANTLALAGKKPFVFIYSSFLQRGYDQIVHDIARCQSNVTLLIDRAGFVPSDGASHQGIFDIPMLMSIPNIVISMPKDSRQAHNLIYTSINYKGLMLIRYPKINIKYDYNKPEKLDIGSWEIIKKGTDAFIITYGDFVQRASFIASEINKNVGIINARFLKPIDERLFRKLLSTGKPIIVYEESMQIGSLGSYLSMKSSEYNYDGKIYTFAIKDNFPGVGTREELIKQNKLDNESIIKMINDILK